MNKRRPIDVSFWVRFTSTLNSNTELLVFYFQIKHHIYYLKSQNQIWLVRREEWFVFKLISWYWVRKRYGVLCFQIMINPCSENQVGARFQTLITKWNMIRAKTSWWCLKKNRFVQPVSISFNLQLISTCWMYDFEL